MPDAATSPSLQSFNNNHTGATLAQSNNAGAEWPLHQHPFLAELTKPVLGALFPATELQTISSA